jgi:hypothetical protein
MPFEAIDVIRCQAEKPNGCTFMTLGGKPGLIRCKNKPKYIAIEKTMKIKDDDFQGAMSMCINCKDVFITQMASRLHDYAIAELID